MAAAAGAEKNTDCDQFFADFDDFSMLFLGIQKSH